MEVDKNDEISQSLFKLNEKKSNYWGTKMIDRKVSTTKKTELFKRSGQACYAL